MRRGLTTTQCVAPRTHSAAASCVCALCDEGPNHYTRRGPARDSVFNMLAFGFGECLSGGAWGRIAFLAGLDRRSAGTLAQDSSHLSMSKLNPETWAIVQRAKRTSFGGW